eukprot:scaffold80011_cov50-Phaeocystis_antarctica.AAC.2
MASLATGADADPLRTQKDSGRPHARQQQHTATKARQITTGITGRAQSTASASACKQKPCRGKLLAYYSLLTWRSSLLLSTPVAPPDVVATIACPHSLPSDGLNT